MKQGNKKKKKANIFSLGKSYVIKHPIESVTRETIRRGFVTFLFFGKVDAPFYMDLYNISFDPRHQTRFFKMVMSVLIEQIALIYNGKLCWNATTTVLFLLKRANLPRELYPIIMEDAMIPIEDAIFKLMRAFSYMGRFFDTRVPRVHCIRTKLGMVVAPRLWGTELIPHILRLTKELLDQEKKIIK